MGPQELLQPLPQNTAPSPGGQSPAPVPKPCPGARAAPAPMALHLGVVMLEPLRGGHIQPSLSPKNQPELVGFLSRITR